MTGNECGDPQVGRAELSRSLPYFFSLFGWGVV